MKLKRIVFVVIMLFIVGLSACKNNKKSEEKVGNNKVKEEKKIEFGVDEGTKPPNFELKVLGQDKKISLKSLKGKPIVINFFASWCPPCKEEIPDLNKIYEKYGKDIELVGIDVGESSKQAQSMVDEFNMEYPILLDESGDVSNNYLINSIPTTIVVDKSGVIKVNYKGLLEYKTLEEIILAL